MGPTTLCRRGDVVLVPFPFTDLSTSKQRPAVVLSSERYHRATEDCLVAAITSVRPPTLSPTDPRGASFLMLGFSSAGLPIHAVCAITDVLLIITLYRPDPGRWIEWRERREG